MKNQLPLFVVPKLFGILIFLFLSESLFGQVEFEINEKGIVFPRTRSNTIFDPLEGQTIFDTLDYKEELKIFTEDGWVPVGGPFKRDGLKIKLSTTGYPETVESFYFGDTYLVDEPSTGFFYDGDKRAFRGGLELACGDPASCTDYDSNWDFDSLGYYSFAYGFETLADGYGSAAFNKDTKAKGARSFVVGTGTIANAISCMVIGQYNDPIVSAGYNGSDKPLFIIGNGSFATQSNAMVVQANGKIGINTNVPLGHFHIEGEDSFDEPHLRITDNGTDNFIRMRMEREGSASSWTHSARIDDADATNSLYSLAHHDGTSFNFVIRANGDGDLGISRIPTGNKFEVQGNASKTMAGDWLANSDRRIKTEITEIENSYELLNSLRPVKFKYSQEWKDKNPAIKDQFYYNFIAQEYQEVFPESVQGSGEFLEGDDTEILQIDTYNAQIATIAAVKELIKENTEQKEINASLEARIAELNQLLGEVEALKAMVSELVQLRRD